MGQYALWFHVAKKFGAIAPDALYNKNIVPTYRSIVIADIPQRVTYQLGIESDIHHFNLAEYYDLDNTEDIAEQVGDIAEQVADRFYEDTKNLKMTWHSPFAHTYDVDERWVTTAWDIQVTEDRPYAYFGDAGYSWHSDTASGMNIDDMPIPLYDDLNVEYPNTVKIGVSIYYEAPTCLVTVKFPEEELQEWDEIQRYVDIPVELILLYKEKPALVRHKLREAKLWPQFWNVIGANTPEEEQQILEQYEVVITFEGHSYGNDTTLVLYDVLESPYEEILKKWYSFYDNDMYAEEHYKCKVRVVKSMRK